MPILTLPDKEYRAIPALSQSSIGQALSLSGDQWLKRQTEPFQPTAKMKLGTLIHAMILEPHTVETAFYRCPKLDRRKTEHKTLLAEIESNGLVSIDEETWAQAEQVREEILRSDKARILFENGAAESSIVGHEVSGEKIKGKLDYLHQKKDVIVDLKTTEIDLSDDGLKWGMSQYYYKVQAAFYIDLLKRELGREFTFVFLFVNVKPPFEMRKVIVSDALTPDWIEDGRTLYTNGIDKIVGWKKENQYPKLIDSVYIPKTWRKK